MRAALITFSVVLLVTLVLAWTRIGRRLRNDRDDREPRLTTAAKHFVADMDSRARQSGPRWQAPDQEKAIRPPAAFDKATKTTDKGRASRRR